MINEMLLRSLLLAQTLLTIITLPTRIKPLVVFTSFSWIICMFIVMFSEMGLFFKDIEVKR